MAVVHYNPIAFATTPPAGSPQAAALETFWGLGERWWEQFIDGRFHQYGPMVFDQGLHGKFKEPGYLQSLLIGSQYAAEHLSEPLTLDFYKGLHQRLCRHFEGKANKTLMTAKDAVKFSNEIPIWSTSRIQSHSETAAFHYKVMSELPNDKITHEAYEASVDWAENYIRSLQEELQLLNNEIIAFCDRLGVELFVTIVIVDDLIQVKSLICDQQQLEEITQKLFDHDNEQMEGDDDDQVTHIAELFQYLEWLHPFHDGQGRTDLVLLAKLLSESGFNPPILYEPYYSTLTRSQAWLEYLRKGIEVWKARSS